MEDTAINTISTTIMRIDTDYNHIHSPGEFLRIFTLLQNAVTLITNTNYTSAQQIAIEGGEEETLNLTLYLTHGI